MKRRIGLGAGMLLLVAACSPGAEENAATTTAINQAEAPPPAQDTPAVPQLAGQWRVTAINGTDLTQYYTMNASFADGRLTIASECVRIAWSYTQDRNIVSFTPADAPSCGRMRTHNEDEVQPILTQANIVMFSNEGGEAEISGPGGRVTLTRS